MSNSPEFGEALLEPTGPAYLRHWEDIALDPTILGFEFEADTPEAEPLSILAHGNARRLRFYDAYLRDAIQPYEAALLYRLPQDYAMKQLDTGIFIEATRWYKSLGSHNTLGESTEMILKTAAIVELLATNPKLHGGLRSGMAEFAGTLYHELSLSTDIPQLFSVSIDAALAQYELALNNPAGRRKITEWIENPSLRTDVESRSVKTLAATTARYHDMKFAALKRNIIDKLKGELAGKVSPHDIQDIQAEARALQSLALNDFLAFLQPDGMLDLGHAYKWFVELVVRNDLIVGKPGEELVHELIEKQVRRALPREAGPDDNTKTMQFPSTAFDLVMHTYDRTGHSPEPVRVKVKAQTRRRMAELGLSFVPGIYVLDRQDDTTDSAGYPIKYITPSLLKEWALGLQDELNVAPEDHRALTALRDRRKLPFHLAFPRKRAA